MDRVKETLGPWLGLMSAVVGGIGGVIVASPSWDNVTTPGGIGGICLALAGALGSWMSPQPPKM